ncbi:MAG: DNA mismatch repair endonuclease MutL [Phycisphaeraceae bacterium]
MPIRKLPTLLINQIAAGEVIERPASVVKELIENSLDAGATRIEVAIEDGGRQLIRISDNGDGIPANELPLAVEPHATSKLTSAEQLAAIATLGFRGEALASIASVSRLRITSRATRDGVTEDAAAVLEVEGDRIGPVQPAAGSPGTVIEVRDLFFNTPARRKFLRTAPTEFGHIQDTVSRIAMVHHRVAFVLSHNGKTTLDLPVEEDRAERCARLLGQDMNEALLPFEHHEPPSRGGDSVWGLAGQPSLARPTGKGLYLYVNGRPIRDRNLIHAVKEAYRGLMPMDRFPVAVVLLEMDPHAVDVNVHPAKAEVRFRNPSHVHGLVLSAVRQRLLGADLTPTVSVSAQDKAPVFENVTSTAAATTSVSADAFVDYFRRMDPTQKGFVYQEVKRAITEENPSLIDQDGDPALVSNQSSTNDIKPLLKPTPILQVHQSYLVAQEEDGLVIIDQHALHERVMFETLRKRVFGEGKPLESQRLLMPVIVDADADRQTMLEQMQPLLDKIGVEWSSIGPDAIAIQAFPSFLFDRDVDPCEFINDLLGKAEKGQLDLTNPNAEEAALHEVLDMMSCKAAVKAGDKLTEEELSALLARRKEIERSSNCPHGRPTTLRLTLKDLEKQFGRT